MQVRVFVLPGGKLQILVDSGTFEEARAATLGLVQAAQVQGLPIEIMGDVEQHRDDTSHVHVTQRLEGRRDHGN